MCVCVLWGVCVNKGCVYMCVEMCEWCGGGVACVISE